MEGELVEFIETAELVKSLVDSLEVLLVTDKTKEKVIEASMSDKDEEEKKKQLKLIQIWISKCSTEDLQKLSTDGVTRENLQEINGLAKALYNYTFLTFYIINSISDLISILQN